MFLIPDIEHLFCHTAAVHPDFQTPSTEESRTNDLFRQRGLQEKPAEYSFFLRRRRRFHQFKVGLFFFILWIDPPEFDARFSFHREET